MAADVRIDRIATRGDTQLAEVLAHRLAASLAPDRIFGVYRIPDRISGPFTPHSEKRRVVEWTSCTRRGSPSSGPLRTIFRGIMVPHPPERSGAFDRMRASAPVAASTS